MKKTTRFSLCSLLTLRLRRVVSAQLALKADGRLWALGGNGYVSGNEYGQLGDGTNVEKTTPVQIGLVMLPLLPVVPIRWL